MNVKPIARWTGVVLAVQSVAFAVVSYTTHWDWWLHDDMVEKVAERFDLSYANDASKPVQRGDPEWAPLLRLIEQYSPHRGELPDDRPPTMVARNQAITSAKTAAGEWTAPTTPVVLLYRDPVRATATSSCGWERRAKAREGLEGHLTLLAHDPCHVLLLARENVAGGGMKKSFVVLTGTGIRNTREWTPSATAALQLAHMSNRAPKHSRSDVGAGFD